MKLANLLYGWNFFNGQDESNPAMYRVHSGLHVACLVGIRSLAFEQCKRFKDFLLVLGKNVHDNVL